MKKKEPIIVLLMVACAIYISPFPAISTILFGLFGSFGFLILIGVVRIHLTNYGSLESLTRNYKFFRTALFFLIIFGLIIHNWILISVYIGMYVANYISILMIPKLLKFLAVNKLRKLCDSFTKLSKEEKRELRENKKLFLVQEHYESVLIKSKGVSGPFIVAEEGNVAFYISTTLDKETDIWKSVEEEFPPQIFGLVYIFFIRMFAFLDEKKEICDMDSYLYSEKGSEYNPNYDEIKERLTLEQKVDLFKKKWGDIDPRAK